MAASKPTRAKMRNGTTTAYNRVVSYRSVVTVQPLGKIGAKVIRHGQYVTFQLAEVAIPRRLFAEVLRLIDSPRQRPAPTPCHRLLAPNAPLAGCRARRLIQRQPPIRVGQSCLR